MKLHRFYTGPELELQHDFWLHDIAILSQWNKVLRFRAGQKVVLFDGLRHERLYTITELSNSEAHLKLVTELVSKTPKTEIYLLWSLLKKDKNDWVLQKCTELGVSHFIPLIAQRSEKTGFSVDRAQKIVIEAAEQCGRGDIPSVREPISPKTAIDELGKKLDLFICEQDGAGAVKESTKPLGVLIGPEGGWSDEEKKIFQEHDLHHINLHDFTLRAETAAAAAVTIIGR